MQIVAADIGGTHARFTIATLGSGGVASLEQPVVLDTSDHARFEDAWDTFGKRLGRPLPRAASIAAAGPLRGDVLKLTNSAWTLSSSEAKQRLGLDSIVLINDFAAIAHAAARLGEADFVTLSGPDRPLPAEGVISVVGPGTGLGVAQVLRRPDGYDVVGAEGGHISFAPSDAFEDALLSRLRRQFTHVSAERVISGPGLVHIYESLAESEGSAAPINDDIALWRAALAGDDPLARAALDRFCLCLGAFAGDIALAHGASGVVIAGGLGLKLAEMLPRSGFGARFTAKGRFEPMLAALPVKLITHAQPGLYGAAAAFLHRQRRT